MNIKNIENSDLTLEDKVNLILVGGKIVPANLIEFHGTNLNNGVYSFTDGDRSRIITMILGFQIPSVFGEEYLPKTRPTIDDDQINYLASLGIIHPDFARETHEIRDSRANNSKHVNCYFGQTRQYAKELKQACEKKRESLKTTEHPTSADYAIGILLGFPESAVNNYVSQGPRSDIEIPKQLKPFTHYALSKDHAREELETAQKWHDAIKTISPKLYEEINKNN